MTLRCKLNLLSNYISKFIIVIYHILQFLLVLIYYCLYVSFAQSWLFLVFVHLCFFGTNTRLGLFLRSWLLEANVFLNDSSNSVYQQTCLDLIWQSQNILPGTCTLIPTIWFGVSVHRRYYDPAYKNDSFKYEYGACLYVGWVTGVLSK